MPSRYATMMAKSMGWMRIEFAPRAHTGNRRAASVSRIVAPLERVKVRGAVVAVGTTFTALRPLGTGRNGLRRVFCFHEICARVRWRGNKDGLRIDG